MTQVELDARIFEAMLCVLIVRAGGELRLSAAEIADAANELRLDLRDKRSRGLLLLGVRPAEPLRLWTGPCRRPRRRARGPKKLRKARAR
jgi:hypothetical protein